MQPPTVLAGAVLGFAVILHFATFVRSDPVCEQLRDEPANLDETAAQFPLLAIGFSGQTLVLISRDLHVYGLTHDLLNVSSLDMRQSNPVEFRVKWPKLFADAKDELLNTSGSFLTKSKDLVISFAPDSANQISLWQLHLESDQAEPQKMQYHGLSASSVWVSLNGSDTELYELAANPETGLTMRTLMFAGTSLDSTSMVRVLCLNSQKLLVTHLGVSCNADESKVLWPVKRAFVAADQLFLFGSDRLVYVVASSSVADPDAKPAKVSTVTFKHFFLCPPKTASTEPTNDANSTMDYDNTSTTMVSPKAIISPPNTTGRIVTIVLLWLVALIFIIVIVLRWYYSDDQSGPLQFNFKENSNINKYRSNRFLASKMQTQMSKLSSLGPVSSKMKNSTLKPKVGSILKQRASKKRSGNRTKARTRSVKVTKQAR